MTAVEWKESLKDRLRRSSLLVAAVHSARAHYQAGVGTVRRRALVREYLRTHPEGRLQLGAGQNDLPGWLNTDYVPRHPGQAYLDASRPFPLPDASFRYVFTEHMIEHLSFEQGQAMLRECRRILAPGGRIRVATPNLENFVALYRGESTAMGLAYLEWALEMNGLPRLDKPECFLMNRFVRAWGHQFIYDPPTLRGALEQAGFSQVEVCEPGRSRDPELCGLESHGRHIGELNNAFESMVLEARRPETPR